MTLAKIIETQIPCAMLERVVCNQDIIRRAERDALFKPFRPPAQIARDVVAAYGPDAPVLAYGLYLQIKKTEWKTAGRLIKYFSGSRDQFQNQQASLVSRLPYLPLDQLNNFLTMVTSQICQIVSINGRNQVVLGTGFLVGPDLVLTCKHVLKHFPIDQPLPSQPRVEVYFDFYLGGPVESFRPNLPKARRVLPAQDWYVASSPDTNPEGLLEPKTPDDHPRLCGALDFVLFRIAEMVGLEAADRNGGRRRQWVDVLAGVPAHDLLPDAWVIIPQHPNGNPQRIDLGRFRALDFTNTRLRYNTNTAAGSSGAPCFNEEFKFLGVHNAYVGPQDDPILNQAICGSCIKPLLLTHLGHAPLTSPVDRWSVTKDGEDPRVILGRQTLLTWLRADPAAYADPLAHRIYAACADAPHAGCTFSIDVLEAETREQRAPRAVYGKQGQQLPSTAEDFLLSLLRELEIGLPPGEIIPYRPRPLSADSAMLGSPKEVDKLERWISQELPEWLGRVIEAHVRREIDIRDEARKAVDTQIRLNLPVSEDLREIAEAAVPRIVQANTWEFAYVVLDDLRNRDYAGDGSRTELKGEVLKLIAALVRGKSEAELHPGLKNLRWMFLGYLPDFVPASTGGSCATVELLDPAAGGAEEIVMIFERMAEAHARMKVGSDLYFSAMAGYLAQSAVTPGEPRLKVLQTATSNFTKILLSRLEV